jgi:hypothetical protein
MFPGWDTYKGPEEDQQTFMLDLMMALQTNLPKLFPSLPMEVERLIPPLHKAHGFVVHVMEGAQARRPGYPRVVSAKATVRPVHRFGDNRDHDAIERILKAVPS